MSAQSKWIALLSAVAHLVMGYILWTNIGFVSSSATLSSLERWLPTWFWPVAFMLDGFTALMGMRHKVFLRISFRIGAALMIVAALGAMAVWLSGESTTTIPSAIWLFYVGLLKWMIAEYAFREERIAAVAANLAKQVEDTTTVPGSGTAETGAV